ncbi:serine/threonine-protein kinase [Streptomyces sp. BA2]|uniref:serine/threonine-protein kinase n=1 Tax=Streptomyces sp. BA2 TaxID=436595 RepID=UPI00132CB38F|nr:serine/threonine-protein kinase [Streptomyces sp. BA2]MWA11132.1 protein kinase [Streptomyces sp. BA2]
MPELRVVAGRYRLLDVIGQGGMGRVWRAADELLDRRVAVKEMRVEGAFEGPETEEGRVRRERALREARASARIDHPGVVRVYDVVEEDGRLWIVMELVDARSLARYVDDEGPLDEHAAARVGLALVAALRRVHAAGVVHRDIKPENVLLGQGGPAGRVVLTDFGIAALQDSGRLTQTGMLVGSPEYMAPERVSGAGQGPPSDLWSLGATLCTALRGSSPFARTSALNTLVAVLHEAPELPPEPSGLRPLLSALLAKDPAARPDLDAVEEALRAVLARPTPSWRGPGDRPRADWRPHVLTAVVLLVAAAVAAVMFFTARDPGGGGPPGPSTPPPTVAGTSTAPPSDGTG